MIDDLKAYPAMKDSGVPWLGAVPSTWAIARNGALFAQRNETGFADLPILEVSLKTGVRVRNLDGNGRKQVMADRNQYKRVRKGDLAYNMMRMWQGAIGIAPVDGLVSPAYVVAHPFPGIESRFFEYLFRTDAYMSEVDKFSHGIVKDRNRLYWEEFKQMPSPVPPSAEQSVIVRFLNHADRQIRRFINAKQQTIALLEEQSRTVVHGAVTRGLDPSARLKTSGIEWLGSVPAHWKILPLRRVTIARCDGPFGSGLKSAHYTDQGIRVVRLQNIGHGEFKDSAAAFISPAHYASLGDHSVLPGDVLIAGLGDERHPAGRACVAPSSIIPAMVKADCFRFRLDTSRLIPTFAALHLTATAVGASAAFSTGATRQRTNLQGTGSRAICVPPLDEQGAIVTRLSNCTASLRATIGITYREISLLREWRTRLIAEVVSGNLDVREAAAQLPAEADDTELRGDAEVLADSDENGEDLDVEIAPDEAEV